MAMIQKLKQEGYIILRDFFEREDTERMARRLKFLADFGHTQMDIQCPKSHAVYSDVVHEIMHEKYRGKLEHLIDANLFPTYTYARLYQPKEVLEKHRDRPSCEISITATLEYDTFDDKPWSLYLESLDTHHPEHSLEITLWPGDAVVYLGCILDHWRDPFVGVMQSQVFMHYVNADGPYAEYKYDCRPSLGLSHHFKDNEKFEELNRIHNI